MFTLRSKWPSWWYALVALVEFHLVRFHPFQNDFGCPNAWFHQLKECRSSLPHGDAKMMGTDMISIVWGLGLGSLVEWWDMVRCCEEGGMIWADHRGYQCLWGAVSRFEAFWHYQNCDDGRLWPQFFENFFGGWSLEKNDDVTVFIC